jgi:hypothetical protein
MSERVSIEQHCRDLLEVALNDGLVSLNRDEWGGDPHPQARTAGELCSVANCLSRILQRERANKPQSHKTKQQ